MLSIVCCKNKTFEYEINIIKIQKKRRPGKGIQTNFSLLQIMARMFHSTKKMTLITGRQGEEEASGAES